MGRKLLNRSEFARLAKVSASTISSACKDRLAAACKGSRIDITHPDAVEFLQKNDPSLPINKPPIAKGIDALYQDCVDHANAIGRLSTNSLQTKFGIGYDRAKKIRDLIDVSGAFDPYNHMEHTTTPVVTTTQVAAVAAKLSMIEQAQAILNGSVRTGLAAQGQLGGETFRDAVERRDTEGSILAPEDDGDQLPGLNDFEQTGVESLADWTLRAVVLKYGTHERFKGWLQAYKSIVDIAAKEITNAEKRGQLVPRSFVESHIMGHYDRAHINLMTDASQTISRRLLADIKAGATVEDCEVFVSDQISRHIQEAKASIARALDNV